MRSTTINAMMNTLTWMISNEEPHRKLRQQVEKIKKAIGFRAAYTSGRASGRRAKRRAG
jgi:hypothetical protein